MAHSHKHVRAVSAGHKRAQQFLHENAGGHVPHKKSGGGISLRGKPARGNDSEAEMMAEGHAPKRRARGGKIKSIKVNIHGGPHLHLAPGMTPGAGGPQPGPGLPPTSPMAGSAPMSPPPPGGMPMPMRNQGGHVDGVHHAGAATGMSRLAEYHKLLHGH